MDFVKIQLLSDYIYKLIKEQSQKYKHKKCTPNIIYNQIPTSGVYSSLYPPQGAPPPPPPP